MIEFMSEDFLLNNPTAKTLYFEALSDVPIFDFHCHILAEEIYTNKVFNDISDLWLKEDHYKWRAMRNFGIQEKYITGKESTNYEKFTTWASVLPECIGNVIYNWSHLELLRCFGIHEELNTRTADAIWEKTNEAIISKSYAPRTMLQKAQIKILSTTDDPADNLEYHKLLASDDSFNIKVIPTWRPDKIVDITGSDFKSYVKKLESTSQIKIQNYDDIKKALLVRMDYFGAQGCLASDHSLSCLPYRPTNDNEINMIFERRMNGSALSKSDIESYITAIMFFFATEYKQRGWAMQLHLGVKRNNNAKMYEKLGPDSGFDSIDDVEIAPSLSKFMNKLTYINKLPKTIIFTLNPKDYYLIASMIGNYQTDEISGKIQFGPAWWFNDHIDGIKTHFKTLANIALVSNFVGMVTDSRCYLSVFSRHEIFRRLICDMIGKWVEDGQYPNDMERLFRIVRGISYDNAKEYFGI